jgi:hypothetical protein
MLRTDRAGFGLPLAILLIAVMTGGAMTAFARATSETRTRQNDEAAMRAFAVAEAGLAQHLARGKVTPADTTYVFADGSAQVTTTLLRAPATPEDTSVYLVRSVGTATAGATGPAARRTVAQLAYFSPMFIEVKSAWTSLSGLRKNGASGSISGNDGCSADALPGVAVPNGEYSGFTSPITGDPPIQEMGTQEEMADQINIDWAGITDPLEPAIIPDVVICRSGTTGYISGWGPCGSWPSSSKWADPDYWPVVLVNGSIDLPTDGRGTLIVTGNLAFGGGDQWNGVVLVGSTLTDNGTGNISGGVISGLNVKKGMTVDESSRANGTKDYEYNSCDIASAANAMARMRQITNAWVDNWSTL